MSETTPNLGLTKIDAFTVDWTQTEHDNLDKIDANNPKHNFTATADPTPTNDSSEGYGVGSVWVNTSSKTSFQCMDATEGSAVWDNRSGDMLKSVYDTNNNGIVDNAEKVGGFDASQSPTANQIPVLDSSKQLNLPFAPPNIKVAGQDFMSRTFYVDAVNGDDSNDGSSGSPFKTIKKACDSVPVGGYGYINLVTDNNVIDADIHLFNKLIRIYGGSVPDSSNPTIYNTGYTDSYGNATYGFILTNSYLEFRTLTIKTASFVDTSKGISYYEGIIKRNDTESNNRIVLASSSIILDDTDFCRLSDRQSASFVVRDKDKHHTTISNSITINQVGANRDAYLILNEAVTFILGTSNYILGTKPDGSTKLTWNDLVTGIVKDTNGVPRNVLSNIIF